MSPLSPRSAQPRTLRPFLVVIWVTGAGILSAAGCAGSEDRPTGTREAAVRSRPAATMSSSRPAGLRDRPTPPGAREFVQQRAAMVQEQLADPSDGRPPVKDPAVLEAMRLVPRHAFVPRGLRHQAYADSPLPIGEDQTISQPYIVALMTEALQLTSEAKVLEIGTGSGYQAAVLAHFTPHVYTIEIVEPLARRAQGVLREQGYEEVHTRTGDGDRGWPEAAPFDAIIVTCAVDQVPTPLWEQLRPGGRIVIPLGPAAAIQELAVVHKTPDGRREVKTITLVRFVPMTGEPQRQ